jgi:hypothetical protein
MKRILLGVLALLPLLLPAQVIPYVVFNELNMDNPGGPDTQEFVELYGTPDASLDSLVIVLYEGNTGVSYQAFDLDGYSLNANGFFTIGNAAVTGVDYILPDATISNGEDAIALYVGNATDFPNGTAPTSADMIDAAVYGTGDPTATALIAGLGLDILVPGYFQLDETAQQFGADLSLSRIPDGGDPFSEATFVLQVITPDTWNQAQCSGGTISFFTDGSLVASFCDNLINPTDDFAIDSTAFGTYYGYAITNSADLIIAISAVNYYDFTGFLPATYHIYGFAYNGVLDSTTLAIDQPVGGILDNSCLSLTSNFATVIIEQCTGCIGATISDSNANTELAFCQGSEGLINFINTTTSVEASYLYVLVDSTNAIVTTSTTGIDFTNVAVGIYSVYGMSYLGILDGATTEAGDEVNLISSSICANLSDNFVSITVFNCTSLEPCTTLFFSEYLEGNGGTKALEIFNPTLSDVDLSAYSILNYSNGATTPTVTFTLNGILGPLSTYLVVNPGTGGGGGGGGQPDPAVIALADTTSLVANNGGNDAIELRLNDVVVDVIGVVGEDPGNNTGWPVGTGTTRNQDLVRMSNVQAPMNIWLISATQWDVYALDDFSHLGLHDFTPCSTDLLAGIGSGDLTVQENVGTINVTVNAYNVSNPLNITVNVTNNNAQNEDYNGSFPVTLVFDGTNSPLTIPIDIIDDLITEGDETFTLTLTSTDNVSWLTQSITITILASDPNCDGGNITYGNFGPVQQCSDLPNPTIDITTNSNLPANYVYVITDANDLILEIITGPSVNMDAYAAGTYHIWGLSYSGTLDNSTTAVNSPVDGIIADTCYSVSNNFITVNRQPCIITGCSGGEVMLSDSTSYITFCQDALADIVSFINTGQSIDDQYAYFLTDASDNIIQQITGLWNANDMAIGTYHIWGVSYQGALDNTTIAAGMSANGISASTCAELSSNFVEVGLYDCSGAQGCSLLFFSEYLEGNGANRALEIFNPTSQSIDFTEYSINYYSNGSANPTATFQGTGTIASLGTFVIVSPGFGGNQADAELVALADVLDPVGNVGGNDAVELVYLGTTVDLIGIIGDDPGNQGWAFGNSSTANNDLVRRTYINSPSADWAFVAGQWEVHDLTDYSHIGSHQFDGCSASPMQISFDITTQSVTEDVGAVQITVEGFGITTDVSVTVTAVGTATANFDYATLFPLTLNFNANINSQTFIIPIVNDIILEGDETIEMSLSSNDNVSYINQNSTIIILENDVIGVSEIDDSGLKIYPNPVADQLYVNAKDKISSWTIYDMSGRIVLSQQNLNINTLSIDISNLAIGQYVIKMNTSEGLFHTPVMVVR